MSCGQWRPVVFDIGNVLIRWDPHPAIAAEVGDERASAFLAADDFDFWSWNLARDAGVTDWDEGESSAAAQFPHWEREIRSYRTHFRRSLSGGLEASHQIIEELHAAEVPLYGLTNWASELFPVALEVLPVLGRFADIVVSGDERVAKPDPRIWQILLARTGRAAADLVFTDDNAANIAAARAAGIDAILFTTPDHLRADLITRGYPLSRTPPA